MFRFNVIEKNNSVDLGAKYDYICIITNINKMYQHRELVGISLAVMISIMLYLDLNILVLVAVNIAAVYDGIYLYTFHRRNPVVSIFVIFLILTINMLLYNLFMIDPWEVVKIVLIPQISDAYQYYVGHKYGYSKIGWISKNKSYEGYIGGYLLTLFTLMFFYSWYEITILYMLGVIGGLLSSCYKRYLGIKDYSDLLGSHGGWLDRTDSIILPTIYYIIN
jgi:phosphatidate cytidylyltransferase